MNELKVEKKLHVWPSPQDYNEAVQDLAMNMSEPDCRIGQVEVNALGLPLPRTGAFASVYRVERSGGKPFALRCFLRDVSDQRERYALISDFIENDKLPYTVTFKYLSQGLRVNGRWFPALKMEWVSGLPLDVYVRRHLGTERIPRLAESFKTMCSHLRRDGIAHGDLQHGNIIVCDEELRLVDYDGMFVPAMKGSRSHELGHPNYQHPGRTASHFDANLDNFSAWVIYACLRALTIDPTLFNELNGGDDCLLFRRSDFLNLSNSRAFATLWRHENAEIRTLARFLLWQCTLDPSQTPPLSDRLPRVPKVVELPAEESIGDTTRGAIPDWLQNNTVKVRRVQKDRAPVATTATTVPAPPPATTALPATPPAAAAPAITVSVPTIPAITPANPPSTPGTTAGALRDSVWCLVIVAVLTFCCIVLGAALRSFSLFCVFIGGLLLMAKLDADIQKLRKQIAQDPSQIANGSAPAMLPANIERELAAKRPRSVMINPEYRGVASGHFARDRQLAVNGVAVQGTIIAKNKVFVHSGQTPYPDEQCVLEYVFPCNGQTHRQKVEVSHYEFSSFNELDKVTVLYDERDPKTNNVIYKLSSYLARPTKP